ncbi:MAG: HAMP domain-containing sensor histidine kinase [Luteolibacter sp.]|uniref:sensor histidine kinase n=1 Tax=Luteolibacter sp. TaxID=1962973 RepID=UPI003265230A
MNLRPGSSLRWLTLAVLLPLLVLGGLAWIGTRAQVKAAWSSAREEAGVSALVAEEVLSRQLASAVEIARLFPDPPVPGIASPADAVLEGKDPAALLRLRDDPDAGLSPAGLPRRVLAGIRLYELNADPAGAPDLIALVTTTAPSVLTARILGDVASSTGDTKALGLWSAGERARAILRLHPAVDSLGKWIDADDGTWWLASDGKQLSFLDPAHLQLSIATAAKRLPAWAELDLSIEGWHAARPPPANSEVMASLPVHFAKDCQLKIIAVRPALFEAAARQQAQWTLALLAFAVAISAGALVLIHRTVERERRLNAMKSDFVASVSHELRAPVASIRLMADALNAEKIEPATVRDFHRLISREGARLSTLIENVLDFARIEQGRKSWHFEHCDLGALVAETLEIMKPLAAEKSIALVSGGAIPPVEANVDPGAIQQALVNLLDNAIKFSPASSRVEISLSGDDTLWKLRIADEGPGIPSAEHQRIFEKFHRLGSELRRETQGTGIGLSLVKAVAEAHGGKVSLEIAVKGSVFTITCPIRPTGPIP